MMTIFLRTSALLLLSALSIYAAERINHEGRILGPVLVTTAPVLFNTSESDQMMASLQMFPADNPWNEDISRRPLLSNSDAMIAKIQSELQSDRRTLRAFDEMNFVIVPANQPLVSIDFFNYPDESDPSPYPIPSNLPIEGWPKATDGLSLADWQEDINDDGGDRHGIIIQPSSGFIWETWLTKRNGSAWEASNGAKFDMNSNQMRPAGWTSGDAAGLSMLAGLARYDECERGMVEHALRLVVKHTRREFIYPATHSASVPSTIDANVPAMGQRLRLKASFQIPPNWTKQEKAVALALKKYGAIVADNGNFFSISVAPDNRFPEGAFDHFRSLTVTNFEVIQTTGPNEGPRSPGAPKVNAGPDQTITLGTELHLAGSANLSNAGQVQWKIYSGPGDAIFADPSQTNTTVSLSKPGTYTLMLSADDGAHAVAYDAIVVTVTDGATALSLQAERRGNSIMFNWGGGSPPFQLEQTTDLLAIRWNLVLETNMTSATLPIESGSRYFRVRGH